THNARHMGAVVDLDAALLRARRNCVDVQSQDDLTVFARKLDVDEFEAFPRDDGLDEAGNLPNLRLGFLGDSLVHVLQSGNKKRRSAEGTSVPQASHLFAALRRSEGFPREFLTPGPRVGKKIQRTRAMLPAPMDTLESIRLRRSIKPDKMKPDP